jgi:sterol desaturase/sphingolipid hydroxylase (fatty acid hydroxylase superfamily)
MNTPTHHAMHHEKVGANYGLHFNFWDRMLGTNHAEYERRFAAVTAPRPSLDVMPAGILIEDAPS